MAENTREIVLDILLSMEREKEYSNRLLGAVLDKYDYLDMKDKAFIKRVTEGCVERRIELDYYLDSYSSVPVRKMKPLIRCLLRMSVYQLLYMDSVPDSAVCNEACKLASKRKFQNLRGFVNGILRNIARNRDRLPMPDRDKEPLLFLSVRYSMPEWIVQLWLDEYGREITETLLKGLMEIHPVSLRFSGKVDRERREELLNRFSEAGAEWHSNPYLPYMYTLEKCAGVNSLPGFEEGCFTVQDVSSALAVEAAGIGKNDFCIDACAAPGGKSMLAAEKAAKVLSRDVSGEKTALIEENKVRMGLENIQIQIHDATIFDENLREKADVLLLDVPCSGLGVIGKKRDIKYYATKEGLKSLCELQKKIVEASWKYVKPGGILLYSTCTVNTEENERMVQFIAEELPFEPVSLSETLPEEILAEKQRLAEMRENSGKPLSVALSESEKAACIQLLPGFVETDGFFIARFRRKGKAPHG